MKQMITALLCLCLTAHVSMAQAERDFSRPLAALKKSFETRDLEAVKGFLSPKLKLGPMPEAATAQILTQVFANFPELKKLELVSTHEDHVKVTFAFAGIPDNESAIYFDEAAKISRIEFIDNVINEEIEAQKAEARSVKQPTPGELGEKFISQPVTFKSRDGLLVSGNLYEIDKAKPVILLCHQAGWNKFEYADIAPKLNELGYNCLAMDQRSGGELADHANETATRAMDNGQRPTFVDAEQDIEAALAYLANRYGQKVILWGSSYSSGLALFQAKNEHVRAVLSFSPGDYYGDDKPSLSTVVPEIKKPVFITSSRKEGDGLKDLLTDVTWGKDKIHFVPESEGFHGSRALWEGQEGAEEYWKAVVSFLSKISQ